MKPTPEHYDKLGKLVKVGDCVAFSDFNTLKIGLIKKLNPKMLSIKILPSSNYYGSCNKYSDQCIIIEGPEVTMYLLKESGK